jgi:hypothetical protein
LFSLVSLSPDREISGCSDCSDCPTIQVCSCVAIGVKENKGVQKGAWFQCRPVPLSLNSLITLIFWCFRYLGFLAFLLSCKYPESFMESDAAPACLVLAGADANTAMSKIFH